MDSLASMKTGSCLTSGSLLSDRYRLEQELGTGGQGAVYSAFDTVQELQVAVKFVPAELARDRGAEARLKREAKHSLLLTHEHIVRLYTLQRENEYLFLVMEYMNGSSLDLVIGAKGTVAPAGVFLIGRQVAEAMAYAHRKGILHRDLKPKNIMIHFDQPLAESEKEKLMDRPLSSWPPFTVKVADFGLAVQIRDSLTRLTGQGSTSGTLVYMSPQQLDGRRPSQTDDIYSFGCVLYEMLNGEPPFMRGDLGYQIRNVVPPDIPGVEGPLLDLVMKCLEKRPEKRYQTFGEVMNSFSKAEAAVAGATQAGAELRRLETVAHVPKTGQEKIVDLGGGKTLELVWIPPGEFTMGSPDSESGRDSDEGPQHRVKITKGFWMGKYEVTQEQWQAVLGNNPSYFQNCKNGALSDTRNFPVEQVSWNDTQEFLQKLSRKTDTDFRLPTEAEWEYACRAGTDTVFHYGDSLCSKQAKFDGNYPYGGASMALFLKKTAPVGSYHPNAFGLYDMHGNVWEWCQDWYNEDYFQNSPVSDPQGPSSGDYRVLRGGSWYFVARSCRSADRFRNSPDYYSYVSGFRVVCMASQD